MIWISPDKMTIQDSDTKPGKGWTEAPMLGQPEEDAE